MKQHEAVMKVMEEKGGYATLGLLYQEVLKIPGVEWKKRHHLPVFAALSRMKGFSSK